MSLPCGKRIPASEHAVSLSLPTLRDVIGYEEKSAAVLQHVCSGYPRFVRHWTVARVQSLLQARFGCKGPVVALHEVAACSRLMAFLDQDLQVLDGLPFGAVELPAGDDALMSEVQRFLQHTGLMLSSRQAEDVLIESGVTEAPQPEARFEGGNPGAAVRQALAGLYGVSGERVGLYPSGMNAYFSVFDSLDRQQRRLGHEQWLQVGWLYLDTTAILDRFARRKHLQFPVAAVDAIEAYIAQHHDQIAGITTEVMTNPLLQTPDLARLGTLARRFNLPLIVDLSMPTPVNVEVFPHADVVIESLTKFASGHADVMGGAAIFNPGTEWGRRLRETVPDGAPYRRDLQRLAHSIGGYAQRMARINDNATALVDYFRSCRRVKTVHWAGQPDSENHYNALRRPAGGNGGVVSVVFEKPLETVYDRLDLRKGPSFGTVFTLCMPYVYMAHYDMITTSAGRKRLKHEGIDPELLRISVGTEPIDDLIRAFESAS